jgi:hypothetical protein
MTTLYLAFGFAAFWIVAAVAAAISLAAIAGIVCAIIKAYCGAADWIALGAVDRFTGMTKDQRDAAFHRASEKLYRRGRFDAQRGHDAIAVIREMIADLEAKP